MGWCVVPLVLPSIFQIGITQKQQVRSLEEKLEESELGRRTAAGLTKASEKVCLMYLHPSCGLPTFLVAQEIEGLRHTVDKRTQGKKEVLAQQEPSAVCLHGTVYL